MVVIWQEVMSPPQERIAMNSCPESTIAPRPQLTLVAMLKFAVVIGFIVAVALPFSPSSFHYVFVGGATGMFVAEYFCRTRPMNFIALLIVPALFVAVSIAIPFLEHPGGIAPTELIVWAFIGFLVAIVPAAISVVVISIVCRLVFSLTGIRLLKFDWGVTETLDNNKSTLAN